MILDFIAVALLIFSQANSAWGKSVIPCPHMPTAGTNEYYDDLKSSKIIGVFEVENIGPSQNTLYCCWHWTDITLKRVSIIKGEASKTLIWHREVPTTNSEQLTSQSDIPVKKGKKYLMNFHNLDAGGRAQQERCHAWLSEEVEKMGAKTKKLISEIKARADHSTQ